MILPPDPKPVLIDGLNVAYWLGRPPSIELPAALAEALRQRGHDVKMIFDASTPHRLPETEHGVYATLLQTGQALQTAKGIPADRQLLRLARRLGALVVSRDSFRNHRSRYRRLIDEPGRLLGGFVENGTLSVPGLEVTAPLIRP